MTMLINQLLRAAGSGGNPFAEPADTQISDRFARADSATSLGSTSSGQAWTAHTGTWGIAGGGAYCVTQTGDTKATFDSGLSDFDFYCDIEVGNTDTCVMYRFVDINNYFLLQIDWTVTTNTVGAVRLWRVLAGAFTSIAGPYNVPAGTAGWRGKTIALKASVSGTSHSITIDGVAAVLTATDTNFQTATRVGLFTNKAAPAQRHWDNLLVVPPGTAETKRFLEWRSDRYSPSRLLSNTSAPRLFSGWADPAKESTTTIATGDRWRRRGAATALPVIVDTDFSVDIEDLFALKANLVYQAEGFASILGVVVCTSNSKAPGAVAATCRAYGYPSIPVASIAPLITFDPGTADTWVPAIYDNYDHTGYGLATTVTDSRTALTQWLTNAPTGVTYLMLGFARALVDWLQQSAANVTLFNSKVSRIVAMVGSSVGGGEFNLINDTASWDWLNTNSSVPIHWAPLEVGNNIGNIGTPTYYNARNTSTSELLRFALASATLGVGVGRPGWDTSTTAYAYEGPGWALFTVQQGTNAINTGTQRNTWTPGAGRDFMLFSGAAPSMAPNQYCESLVAASVRQGNLTWNGSAWA